MIDNLDDAIQHCLHRAEENRAEAEKFVYGQNNREACLDCAAEHEQLAGWLEELAERREADRWIPVSERLPEPQKPNDDIYNTHCSDFVLVCTEWWNGQKAIEIASYDFDDEEWVYHGSDDSEVIAWRPLPKAPESEGK